MKPLQTTPKDVLREAIQSEVDSREFLLKLAERGKTDAVRGKILEFADRELLHRAKLERKFRDEIGAEPPEPEPPRAELGLDLYEVDLSRALKIILEKERESESNYRFLAERVPNTELGALFMELAEMEWKHKIEVQREYDASLNDPEQFLYEF
jgi:rubrerythrin